MNIKSTSFSDVTSHRLVDFMDVSEESVGFESLTAVVMKSSVF
jgi:hypothetical protein